MLHLNATLIIYYLDPILLPAKQMEHGVLDLHGQKLMVTLTSLCNIILRDDSIFTSIIIDLFTVESFMPQKEKSQSPYVLF